MVSTAKFGFVYFSLLSLVCEFAEAVEDSASYLSMDLNELLSVRITGATLTQESLKTVPAVVTVFSRDQLDSLGFDYLYELVRLVPGFQVNRSGEHQHNYTFSAAGRRLGANAREIALIVDGKKMANPIQTGADSATPLYPLSHVERVEFILGPGSAIYGSSAFTGVINIVTRQRDKEVNLAVGKNRSSNVNGHLSSQWADMVLGAFLSVHSDDGQRYALEDAGFTTDDYKNMSWDVTVNTARTGIQLSGFSLDSWNFYVQDKPKNGVNFYSSDYYKITVEEIIKKTEESNLVAGIFHQQHESTITGEVMPYGALFNLSAPPSLDALVGVSDIDSRETNYYLNFDGAVSPGLSFQGGLEYVVSRASDLLVYNNFDLTALAEKQFPIAYYGDFNTATLIAPAFQRESYGSYGQWIIDLGKDKALTIGGRYDYFDRVGENFSPRVSYVHQFSNQQAFKVLYGEAFRAPTFLEVNVKNNLTIQGNENLRYEIVKNLSFSWLYFRDGYHGSISVFENRYINPIVPGFDGIKRTYINSEKQNDRGVIVDLHYAVSSVMKISMSYTQLMNLSDAALFEAVRMASVISDFRFDRWVANLSASYQGGRGYRDAVDSQRKLDSEWLVNGRIGYYVSRNIDFEITAKNLFGNRYFSAPQGVVLSSGVPNRGREWSVGVNWRW